MNGGDDRPSNQREQLLKNLGEALLVLAGFDKVVLVGEEDFAAVVHTAADHSVPMLVPIVPVCAGVGAYSPNVLGHS